MPAHVLKIVELTDAEVAAELWSRGHAPGAAPMYRCQCSCGWRSAPAGTEALRGVGYVHRMAHADTDE